MHWRVDARRASRLTAALRCVLLGGRQGDQRQATPRGRGKKFRQWATSIAEAEAEAGAGAGADADANVEARSRRRRSRSRSTA